MLITGKFIFVITIIVWLSVGFLGLYNMDKKRPNYEFISFLFFTPLIPLVAKICEIF